jgi:hypothetical protein
LLFALPACGDDGGGGDPCANLGPHDPVPAECEQLGFNSPEGGEVRFEYMEWSKDCGDNADQPCGPDGRTTATRVVAYGMTNMEPQAYPMVTIGGCTNLAVKTTWPLAQGANRQYADTGALTLTGGPNTIDVPDADPANPDVLGRSHDKYQFYFGADDTDQFVSENTNYTVNWAGSDTMPAQTFDNAIYMPGAYTLQDPGFQANIDIPNSGDFSMTWGDEGNSELAASGGTMLSLIAFAIPGVGLTHLCVGPDTGEIVIPDATIKEAVALAGYAGTGFLLRGKLTHQLQELSDNDGPTGRRLDMLGIYCYLTGMTFVAP